MELRGKNILILSPQNWNNQKLSKHHYADALARRGNRVLFVGMPEKNAGWLAELTTPPHCSDNLQVARYQLPVPYALRFKWPSLYQRVFRWFLTTIMRRSFNTIDLCIDFGQYGLLDNLNTIPAACKIFFPVDDFHHLQPDLRGAQLGLSVSRNIVEKFAQAGQSCYFIQHGLADIFALAAQKHLESLEKTDNSTPQQLKIGYSGNLMIRFLNRDLFRSVVSRHPEIAFHCFGRCEPEGNHPDDHAWAHWLKSQSNIILTGMLELPDLMTQMAEMDAFWLCYKADNLNYHAENSHKILEYLSTGKLTISTPITIYEGTSLLAMCPADGYTDFFTATIRQLSQLNAPDLQRARIQYALDNTYEKQITRIEALLH